MNEISIDRLREALRLDSETGKLYWRLRRRGVQCADSEAGGIRPTGYRMVCLDGKRIASHRIVFAMTRDRWPADDLDHINAVRDDNRPDNLREATRSQNLCNTGIRPNNTSGVKGVSWHKQRGKWNARIQVESRGINLGLYDDLAVAALVVSEARRKYHGEFARFQ